MLGDSMIAICFPHHLPTVTSHCS